MIDVDIYEQTLFVKDDQGNDKEIGKMAIFKGGIGASNPKSVMDKSVKHYVGQESYNQFVEINLDNPWVRVVIKGINELKYEHFDVQRL